MHRHQLPNRAAAVLAASLLCVSAAPMARAQWNATILNPASGIGSVATGDWGGTQGGWVSTISGEHACLWTGSSDSIVDLHPPESGPYTSGINALFGDLQGGYASRTESGQVVTHGYLWQGTLDSRLDLHPGNIPGVLPPLSNSAITAMAEEWQAGYVALGVGGALHASVWHGSAESWIDLHPASSSWPSSAILGMTVEQQAGIVRLNSLTHACAWSGTVESWVDLHPAGASASWAGAVANGHEFGWAAFGGVPHAGSWTGSAASWVDLNPPSATSSLINGAFGHEQVGSAVVGGRTRACAWSGTPASCVDLDSIVPPSDRQGSVATGIWGDLRFTYVVGYLLPSPGGGPERRQAVLWTRCRADFSADGVLNSGDFFDFLTAFFLNVPAADFNGDSSVTSQDFFDFVGVFLTGCA